MSKPIDLKDGDALLEITLKCYCGCYYCYKCSNVGPKKPHIPLSVLKQRIGWIVDNVDCGEICLIGGEPLLHPNLLDIINLILALGKKVVIITSGRISKDPKEVENYHSVLDLYELGLVKIELSYQSDYNHEFYIRLMQELRKRHLNRRQALESAGSYVTDSFDVVSTAVVDDEIVATWENYLHFVNKVMEVSFNDKLESNQIPDVISSYEAFKTHFATAKESSFYTTTICSSDGVTEFRIKIRLYGQVGILENEVGETSVVRPLGGACPAMRVSITKETITLPSLTVRHDGDICFSTPECISANQGLCNADIHLDPEVIRGTIHRSLKDIKKMLIILKRTEAASAHQYCQADRDYLKDEESTASCQSCPFHLSCNTCHFPSPRKW